MLNINDPTSIMKKTIVFFFFYMIFEGVVRKWILPNLSTQIYFVKDILLILIYIIALKYNLIFTSYYSKILIFIVIIISLFGFVGYRFDTNGIISYLLGLRSYWIFLPLLLIITHIFNKDDLIKFLKLNLYFVIPYFLLVYLQSILPENSFLNSGYDGSILSPERPSAFFTYTTQNTYYFLFLFFSFFSFILDKKEILIKDMIYLTFLNLLLISIMILLKSRAVYFYVFVTVFYSAFFLIFSNFDYKLKFKKIFLISFTFIIFIISSNFLFEKAYKHSVVRMNTDQTKEYDFVLENKNKQMKLLLFESKKKDTVQEFCKKYSTICRIIDDLYILPAVRNSNLFGEGIGAGTKPVVVFNKIKKSFYLGEIDNKRIIMELGYSIGLVLVISKWILVIILNILALFKFRDKNKLIYIPLLLFVSTQLMLGTVSYTVSFVSFIFWVSLGLLFTSFNKKNKNLLKL